MLGSDESGISSRPEEWFRRVHPEDIDRVMAEIAAHFDNVTPQFEESTSHVAQRRQLPLDAQSWSGGAGSQRAKRTAWPVR